MVTGASCGLLSACRRMPSQAQQPRKRGELAGDKWAGAIMQAQARGDRDCPICMGEMATHSHERGTDGGTTHGLEACSEHGCEGAKALVILDCSHVFHESCICAFENFNIYEVQLCPVCRAAYERAPF